MQDLTGDDWPLVLANLGRLGEALESIRAAAESAVKQQDWTNAAIYYGNLSELQLTLGRVVDAVADGRRSVGMPTGAAMPTSR